MWFASSQNDEIETDTLLREMTKRTDEIERSLGISNLAIHSERRHVFNEWASTVLVHVS